MSCARSFREVKVYQAAGTGGHPERKSCPERSRMGRGIP